MKHPRPLLCDKYGGKLKVERYRKGSDRFRRYHCLKCGFSEIFRRHREGYGC